MVDIHTHILQGIDDGSGSIKESQQMLAMYSERVSDVVLTPHFTASYESPSDFLQRRKIAFDKFQQCCEIKSKHIFRLGAEVGFFEGMNLSSETDKLLIEGTNLLLVEMPMGVWTKRMIEQLIDLIKSRNIRPVLAHIDRYGFANGTNKEVFDYYLNNHGLVQVNTSAFNSFFARRKAISMINNGRIHFIGSDAHGVLHRAPNIDKVIDYLNNHNKKTIEIIEKNERIFFESFIRRK